MSALYVLIGISVIVAVVFLIAFIRSAHQGQFDDDYGPSVRILFDDKSATDKQSSTNQITEDAN